MGSVHAEMCLKTGNVDDFRRSIRYAVKHLAELAPAGTCVASSLARAPGEFLVNTGNAIEGLCGVEWPLRIAGLAAATAISARGRVPVPIFEIARNAVEAFVEKHGSMRPVGWSGANVDALVTRELSPATYRAKRRRLLVDITKMQDVQTAVIGPDRGAAGEVVDTEFAELCTAARACIDTWLVEARV